MMGEPEGEGPGGWGVRLFRRVRERMTALTQKLPGSRSVETSGRIPIERLPRALRELRPAHLAESAALLADLVPRSFQTSQIAATQLPALLRLEDPQILSFYHAILVAVLAQEKDSGPALARLLPEQLVRVPKEGRRRFMAQVLRGATIDWNLTVTLAERLPELGRELSGEAQDVFLRRAIALWRESPDKAQSFLRGESRLGRIELESLRDELPLSSVRRTLQLYAQAHGGPRVRLRSLEELPGHDTSISGNRAFTDGRTIYLPPGVSGGAQDQGFRLYKAMTAVEAGRIEFGTFAFDPQRLARLQQPDHAEPNPAAEAGPDALESPDPLSTLRGTLRASPDPVLAEELFGILETFRIEQRLRREYPGLEADLARLTDDALSTRPLPLELDPLPAVLELLALRLWGRPAAEPWLSPTVRTLLDALEAQARPLANPEARVEESVLTTLQGILALERAGLIDAQTAAEETDEDPPESSQRPPRSQPQDSRGGQASAPPGPSRAQEAGNRQGQAGASQPLQFEPMPHQGRIDLALAQDLQALEAGEAPEPGAESPSAPTHLGQSGLPGGIEPASPTEDESPAPPDLPPSEDTAAGGGAVRLPQGEAPPEASLWLYPEWDSQIEDYKDRWCRVFEEGMPQGSDAFATRTLAEHRGIVSRLRRQFQRIRREELEKLKRQPDGDEIDLDAAMDAVVDLRRGQPPSERLYIQRHKHLRDVAVAFLIDMSSSTQQVVQACGKTILDIEKESLLLMSEALETLGDAYAIYGFSGYGRQRVSFYVAKNFEERNGPAVRARISGMGGRLENRDGAAIRHATRKLVEQSARVRLLILLSDGRPLDCGCRQYFERYAQEDTRMALREASRLQVHPFCITVDRQAQRYLSRMYSQVQYTIIDQVGALPQRLPGIYRRLTT